MDTQGIPEEIFFAQIKERSKTDPLVGAKIGAKEITQRLLAALKNERGVHVESLLCALGSLAGYACQVAVIAKAKARGAASPLHVVQTKSGESFFFGDALNKPLAESKYSVWGIAAAGAQEAGCAKIPDVGKMFEHAATVIGSERFGRPRLPEGHDIGELPVNFVRKLWPLFRPLIEKFCPNPDHWPVLFALSIQEVIGMGKTALDPALGLSIAMESAIATSKMILNFDAAALTPEAAQKKGSVPTPSTSAKSNTTAQAQTTGAKTNSSASPPKQQNFPYSVSTGGAYFALLLLPVILAGAGQVALAIIVGVVAVVGIYILRSHSSLPKVVALGPTSVSVPLASARAEMLNVRYEEIQNLETDKAGRSEMLVISTLKGESRLLASGFANEFEYARFKETLAARVVAKRG